MSTRKIRDLLYAADKTNYDPEFNREAMIGLKQEFSQANRLMANESLASFLIRLGQKHDIYWLTLSTRAEEIVNDQTPFPFAYN